MAVSGIGSGYGNAYGNTYIAQKNETAKKEEINKTEALRSGNTPKAGTDSVSDYYSYLQKNYDCVKDGSVAISGAYLKECAKNPDKAKELEENLSYFKEGYENGLKYAQANARALGARLVDYSESWNIDSKGNITVMASTTLDSGKDVKGWRELAKEREEKLKEKKEQNRTEEKKEERRKLKEQEKLKEQQEEAQPFAERVPVISDAYHKPVDIKA